MYTTIQVVRSIIYESVAQGADLQKLCESVGISRSDLCHSEKPLEGIERIINLWKKSLELTNDNYLGLHIGSKMSPSLLGLVGYLMQNSPTLKDAFRSLIEYQSRLSGWISYDLKTTGDEISIVFIVNPIWTDISPGTAMQGTSLAMAAALNIIQMLLKRKIAPLRSDVTFSGRDLKEKYESAFECPILFTSSANQLIFRKTDFDLPLMSYDDSFYALFNNLLKKKEDEVKVALSFKDQLKQTLIIDFKGQVPALAIIASHMNLSTRSFQRRLENNGLNYQTIAKEVRKELAVSLLKNSESKVSDIARVLGYGGVASFRTAFKEWTNVTPEMARKMKE